MHAVLANSLTKPMAEICALYFCAATFHTSAVNGHIEERRISSHHQSHRYIIRKGLAGDFQVHYREIDGQDSSEKFRFNGKAVGTLRQYLNKSLVGFVRICIFGTIYSLGAGPRLLEEYLPTRVNLYTPGIDGLPPDEDVSNDYFGVTKDIFDYIRRNDNRTVAPVFENAAHRLTDFIREPTLYYDIRDVPTKTGNVTGKAFQNLLVVHIGWGWIALPATLELLALFYLVSVMWYTQTKELVPWRRGPVESLFYGPEEDIRKEADEFETSAKLEKFIASVTVRLEKTDDGWRLVRASKLPLLEHEHDQGAP